jgi:hypothetical protein
MGGIRRRKDESEEEFKQRQVKYYKDKQALLELDMKESKMEVKEKKQDLPTKAFTIDELKELNEFTKQVVGLDDDDEEEDGDDLLEKGQSKDDEEDKTPAPSDNEEEVAPPPSPKKKPIKEKKEVKKQPKEKKQPAKKQPKKLIGRSINSVDKQPKVESDSEDIPEEPPKLVRQKGRKPKVQEEVEIEDEEQELPPVEKFKKHLISSNKKGKGAAEVKKNEYAEFMFG